MQFADEIEVPHPACIAVFQFGRCFAHGAIVTDYPMVIHSYNGQVVREQSAIEGSLKDRKVRFFEVKT
jgi:hypothetical protein